MKNCPIYIILKTPSSNISKTVPYRNNTEAKSNEQQKKKVTKSRNVMYCVTVDNHRPRGE